MSYFHNHILILTLSYEWGRKVEDCSSNERKCVELNTGQSNEIGGKDVSCFLKTSYWFANIKAFVVMKRPEASGYFYHIYLGFVCFTKYIKASKSQNLCQYSTKIKVFYYTPLSSFLVESLQVDSVEGQFSLLYYPTDPVFLIIKLVLSSTRKVQMFYSLSVIYRMPSKSLYISLLSLNLDVLMHELTYCKQSQNLSKLICLSYFSKNSTLLEWQTSLTVTPHIHLLPTKPQSIYYPYL